MKFRWTTLVPVNTTRIWQEEVFLVFRTDYLSLNWAIQGTLERCRQSLKNNHMIAVNHPFLEVQRLVIKFGINNRRLTWPAYTSFSFPEISKWPVIQDRIPSLTAKFMIRCKWAVLQGNLRNLSCREYRSQPDGLFKPKYPISVSQGAQYKYYRWKFRMGNVHVRKLSLVSLKKKQKLMLSSNKYSHVVENIVLCDNIYNRHKIKSMALQLNPVCISCSGSLVPLFCIVKPEQWMSWWSTSIIANGCSIIMSLLPARGYRVRVKVRY